MWKVFSIALVVLAMLLLLFLGVVLRENDGLKYEVGNYILKYGREKRDFEEYRERIHNLYGFQGAMFFVSTKEYDEHYHNCADFSYNLQEKLEELGIRSSVVKGRWNGEGHYWITIWVEPREGRFIRPDENYILQEIIK